jgi:transcriptional regulator with XRE-family HTH domain
MPTQRSLELRGKMLGVRLQEAREACGKTRRQCAVAMGITPARLRAYETGNRPLSLPELEVLAYLIDQPIGALLGTRGTEAAPRPESADFIKLIGLRQRMVGTRLAELRKKIGRSRDDLAATSGLGSSRLAGYETGRQPVPIPVLEDLAIALGTTLQSFFIASGPVGERVSLLDSFDQFGRMAPDVRDFVTQPVNEPYLRLAMRMSQLSAERLRNIAEGLLEITL